MSQKWMAVVILLCAPTLLAFKLEKDPVQMTQTETKKAPEPDEEKKVKEVPAAPKYPMDSFDDFLTSSPLQKKPSTKTSRSSSNR